jgi:membrane-associated phospholipid phosphatase
MNLFKDINNTFENNNFKKSNIMNTILKKIRRLDKKVKRNFGGVHNSPPSVVDKSFKWIPLILALVPVAAGIKSKNSFTNKVKIIFLSKMILNSIVVPLKKLVHRRRPDSLFKSNSFPSSHTATSFLGAEILHQETRKSMRAISLAAYPIAITTAALRLYRKKHWFSDIVVGAIIGIVAAKVSYGILKNKSM